jgi:hypothetical protein
MLLLLLGVHHVLLLPNVDHIVVVFGIHRVVVNGIHHVVGVHCIVVDV